MHPNDHPPLPTRRQPGPLRRVARTARAIVGLTTLIAAGTVGLATGPAAAVEPGGDFDMTVSAEATSAFVAAGDMLAYTLTYENLGTDTADQVFLSVQVPEFTTAALGASSPGWQCSTPGGGGLAFANCTVQVGDVAGGDVGTATFAITVDDPLRDGADTVVLFVGCGDPRADGCRSDTGPSGVFVGGSGFPETDYSNNTARVQTPIGSPCAPGKFSVTGLQPCDLAPAGTFVDAVGATQATRCPIGTFQPDTGRASCLLAPPGTFVDTTGAAEATDCSVGTFQSDTGQASCLLAPVGTFVDVPGAAEATACPPGTTTIETGSVSADACLADLDGDGLPDVIDPDDDGDLVLDSDDLCPTTDLVGDVAPSSLKRNRSWSDADGRFGDSGWTIVDTGGCSASQIIDASGLGRGHQRFGLSRGVLSAWIRHI